MADEPIEVSPTTDPDCTSPLPNGVEPKPDRPPVAPFDPYFGSLVIDDFNWASD